MARKKKDEPAHPEPAKSEEVKAMISAGKLKKLLELPTAPRSATPPKIASALGNELKVQEEQPSASRSLQTHPAKKLDKMEPEELRNFMDHFEYYYDVSGLMKRADSVMTMKLEESEDEEEEKDPGEPSNVHAMPGRA